MSAALERIGCVASIYRYPVKSMRGESLAESQVGWHGLAGDRRYAFIDQGNQTGFPWLTARQFNKLVCYEPRFENPGDPNNSGIVVRTPGGREHAVDSRELLDEIARESARAIRLFRNDSGVFDAMNVSIITRRTIAAIGNGVGRDLDVRRFRPNFVLDCDDDQPFCEDRWVGGLLAFGQRGDSARVRVNREDQRCMVICIDPDDLTVDPAILRHVAQTRKSLLGVYGTVQTPGTIHVDDDVFLLR